MPASNSTTPRRLRGVVYGRKSNEDDGASVGQQLEWADSVCPGQQIDIVATFTDQAKKGNQTATRKDFLRMVDYCEQQARRGHPIDVIVAWHTNRFSRSNSFETGHYLHRLMEAGVYCLYTNGKGLLDLRQNEVRALFGMEQELSNHADLQKMAEACLRGRADTARKGQHNGGKVCYGYFCSYTVEKRGKQYRRVPGQYQVKEDEAKIVRRVWETFANTDTSERAIARQLNSEGIPSPGGGKWVAMVISRFLRQEKFKGHMPFGRENKGQFFTLVDLEMRPTKREQRPGKVERKAKENVYVARNTHPAIITDPDVIRRVEAKLGKRAARHDTTAGDSSHKLSGLLVCGHCNGKMWFRAEPEKGANSQGEMIPGYVCSSYARHGRNACTYNRVVEGDLLHAIGVKISEALLNTERRAALEQHLADDTVEGEDSTTSELKRLDREIATLGEQIKKGVQRTLTEDNMELMAAYRQQVLDWQQQLGQIQTVRANLEQTAGDRASQAQRIAEAMEVAQLLPELLNGEGIEEDNPARIRAVLQELVSEIVLFFGRRETAKKVESPFVRSLIYLKEDAFLGFSLATSSRAEDARLQELLTVEFTAADLAA